MLVTQCLIVQARECHYLWVEGIFPIKEWNFIIAWVINVKKSLLIIRGKESLQDIRLRLLWLLPPLLLFFFFKYRNTNVNPVVWIKKGYEKDKTEQ